MTELSQQSLSRTSDLLSRPLAHVARLDIEKSIYLAFILISLATRLYGVGDRVVSHDESLHTQYSYQYYNGDGYQHSPLMHGPSLFHVTALSYWLLGPSDMASRVPVAILGTLLVVLPFFLRGWIGRAGALLASFLLLISPYITYYSRYIRHDIYVITFAAITFIAILHYLRYRQDKYLWWTSGGIALMYTTMETSYIYVAIFGGFLILALAVRTLAAEWFKENLAIARPGLLVIGLALVLLAGGFAGQRLAPRVLAPEATPGTAVVDEGFAADPEQALLTSPATEGEESAAVVALRWLQVAALLLLGGGLFLVIRRLRPHMEQFAEFDLVMLVVTLVLPTAAAFLVVLAGRDPLNYTISLCQLAGQETMSAMELLLARAGNGICRSAFLSSDAFVNGIFVVATLVISVLAGLWWNSRRFLISAAIFHGIFILLFTSFFSNPTGWASGIVGSLGYWLAQQEVQRANQPVGFYFLVLPLYEFLPLFLSLLAMRLWARRERLNKILGYWLQVALVALLVFSLTNWLFNRSLEPEAEPTRLPGILLAAGVLLLGGLYWTLVHAGHIRDTYDLGRGWRGWQSLTTANSLTGFIPYLVWWFLATWVIYTYAGEKMAWLSSHFIFPMVIMAGWYLNDRIDSLEASRFRDRRFALLVLLAFLSILALALALLPVILGEVSLGDQQANNLRGLGRLLGGLILAGIVIYFLREVGRSYARQERQTAWLFAGAGLLALLTMRFNYMAAFPNADYVNEFLVYAHGAPATKSEVLDQLESLSYRLYGDKSIVVAYDNDASWPYTWYLRDYPNRLYFGENPGRNVADAPVLIVGSRNWGKVDPLVGNNYDVRTYTFLWWPMEDYRNISWNAIFGDASVEPELRRGLGKPGVRQALWDIFLHRDFNKYGQVFGGNYSHGQWPLRHELRMYIRKDVLATIWDHGIDAVAAEPPVDPYAELQFDMLPSLVVGTSGDAEGLLNQPRNLAVAADGELFVADSGQHRIVVYDRDGGYLRSWGDFGSAEGLLNEPWGLAVDDEYVYVADTWNHRIQKFTRDGQFVDLFGGSGGPSAEGPGNGLFFGPRDIAIMPDGNLLITDTGNHRLQVLDREGNFVRAVGSQGTSPGQFFEPVGIAIDSGGYVYVADTWNGRIQRLTPDLVAEGEWPVDAWYGESINNKPYLAAAPDGRIYVSDPEAYRVIAFDRLGTYVGRFGQYGADVEGLGLPVGIEVDEAGNLYVADAANNRILRYPPMPAGSQDGG